MNAKPAIFSTTSNSRGRETRPTRRAPYLSLYVLILLILGISGTLSAQEIPPPEPPQPAETGRADTGQALLAQAAAIGEQVGEFRGLALKKDITRGIKNRDQLREILLERLAEEVSNEEIEDEARVYKKLGLLPEDLDYKQALLNILTEQIAGFYDQHAKELYIMEGIPLDLQRPAMAHEIFHAIQDQHFNIKRMTEPVKSQDNGDFSMARSALIEGDASIVMIDYSLYERGVLPQGDLTSSLDIPLMSGVLEQLTRQDVGALAQLMPEGAGAEGIAATELDESALAKAPAMVRKLLVFPYFAGMRFVIHARTNHDWQRVNEIYANPPTSTEQILHPERYFAGDEPILLEFSTDESFEADSLIYENVLGEYQMRLFLEEHLLEVEKPLVDAAQIDEAMLGWGGDRLRAFRLADEQVLIAHLSVWDTIQDANEYFEILEEVMHARFPEAEITEDQGEYGRSRCFLVTHDTRTERVYLEQWGDLILQLEGIPADAHTADADTNVDPDAASISPSLGALRDEIMSSQQRTPFNEDYQKKLGAYDRERAESSDNPDKKARPDKNSASDKEVPAGKKAPIDKK